MESGEQSVPILTNEELTEEFHKVSERINSKDEDLGSIKEDVSQLKKTQDELSKMVHCNKESEILEVVKIQGVIQGDINSIYTHIKGINDKIGQLFSIIQKQDKRLTENENWKIEVQEFIGNKKATNGFTNSRLEELSSEEASLAKEIQDIRIELETRSKLDANFQRTLNNIFSFAKDTFKGIFVGVIVFVFSIALKPIIGI